MSFFHATVPLVLSMHHRYSLLSVSATFRKMLLPQMMGVAPVLLGIASFQTTCSVVLQRSGRSFSPLMPFRFGPRHCGQFSARTGRASTHTTTASNRRVRTSALLRGRSYHSDRRPASKGERNTAP